MNTMESKTKRHLPLGLCLLLAVQLALAAALVWWPARAPETPAARTLFSFDTQAIDRLVIEGPDQARIELKRQGSGPGAGWVVGQAGDFPADAARVRQVIDKLHGLTSGGPVATSAEALERFKVADTGFERRLQLHAGDRTVATLRLGSSQGSRQTAARVGDEREVLGVDWPTWELATGADDWLDKTVLNVPLAEIESIEVDGLKLVAARADATATASTADSARPDAAPAVATPGASTEPPGPAASGPGSTTTAATGASASAAPPPAPRWTASGLAAGQTLDDEAVDRLAQAIAELSFVGLKGAGEVTGTPERRFVVQRRGAPPVAYALHRSGDGDERLLVVDGRQQTFRLAVHQARPLLDGSTRDALTGGAAR